MQLEWFFILSASWSFSRTRREGTKGEIKRWSRFGGRFWLSTSHEVFVHCTQEPPRIPIHINGWQTVTIAAPDSRLVEIFNPFRECVALQDVDQSNVVDTASRSGECTRDISRDDVERRRLEVVFSACANLIFLRKWSKKPALKRTKPRDSLGRSHRLVGSGSDGAD